MTQIIPQDLINIPGAGRAEVALRAFGMWDDGRDESAIEWNVYLTDPLLGCAECTVMATSEEQAIRAAWALHLRGKVRWDLYYLPEDCTSHAVAVEASHG